MLPFFQYVSRLYEKDGFFPEKLVIWKLVFYIISEKKKILVCSLLVSCLL